MGFDRSRRVCLAFATLATTTLAAEAQSVGQGAGGGCTQFGVVTSCQGLGIRGGTPGGGGGQAGSAAGGTSGPGDCTAGSSDVMCMLSRTFGLSDDSAVSGSATGTPSAGNGGPRTFPPVTPQPDAGAFATGQIGNPSADDSVELSPEP